MSDKAKMLTVEERDMLHALAIRMQGVVCMIADIANETGGDPDRSGKYLNGQQIRMSIDTIVKCDEGRYTHNIAAKPNRGLSA